VSLQASAKPAAAPVEQSAPKVIYSDLSASQSLSMNEIDQLLTDVKVKPKGTAAAFSVF
jgi:hypothetical protein